MDDDDDAFLLTPLVPVSQWVFNLYQVKFWSGPPEATGQLLRTSYCVTTDSHIDGEASDECPSVCGSYEWELVKENVGRPHQVGQMYGHRVDESGWTAGAREWANHAKQQRGT